MTHRRENSSHGNEKSSKEGNEEGSEENQYQEKVINPQRQNRKGALRRSLSVLLEEVQPLIPGCSKLMEDMTRRRWIADEWNNNSAALLNEQAVHLYRVLRAHPGQQFDIVTGSDVRRGVIESVADNRVEFSLYECIESTGALPLTTLLSIIRFERMEWAIEKLTELGVIRIVPVIAQRTEKHLAQAAEKRIERWRKIARESAQQSRRSDIPEIAPPLRIAEAVSLLEAQESQANNSKFGLLLSEREDVQKSLRSYLNENFFGDAPAIMTKKIYAAVGPEGGWTDSELRSFTERRWTSVSLGPRILRAETAAVAVASVLNAWLGER